jgi:hypothetical protein
MLVDYEEGGVVCTHCGSHDGQPVYIIHAAEQRTRQATVSIALLEKPLPP